MKNKHLHIPFGPILKKLRSEARISQSELAHVAELDRTYISMLERSCRLPTLQVLIRLSEHLNVKPSEMLRMVESHEELQIYLKSHS